MPAPRRPLMSRRRAACVLSLASLAGVRLVSGGDPVAPVPAVPAPVVPASNEALTAAQIESLVAPVALYPDVILAALIPATAYPIQVVQAARHLERLAGAAATVPERAGWDASVEALLQYADVLAWMNENLDWVEQLGYAVSTQQADVLRGVQAFRAKAKAAGTLVTNAQQTIIVQPTTNVIQVTPTNPEVVYVPVYDPVVVVAPAPSSPPPGMAFAAGVAVGLLGAWAVHELAWDDDFHIHVHGAPYHWNADFNRNVQNNVRINTGDVNIGNSVKVGNSVGGGNRWNTATPARRPSTLPARGATPDRRGPSTAVPRPMPVPASPRPPVSSRPPATRPVHGAGQGPAARPGDRAQPETMPAPSRSGAFDVRSGPETSDESRRGRSSLGEPAPSRPQPSGPSRGAPSTSDRSRPRGDGGSFGGPGAGRREGARGAKSLDGDSRRPN